MKKRIALSVIAMILSLSCLTSCVHPPHTYENEDKKHDFDYDESVQVAQNYMQEKYDVDFDVSSLRQLINKDYVEVWGSIDGFEYDCDVRVFFDESNESYYVGYDGYFQTYIYPMINNWINKIAEQYVGFDEYSVFASLGYEGSSTDIDIPKSVDEIISKGDKAGVVLYIIIPEEEYSDDVSALEKTKELTDYLKSTSMNCSGKLVVYSRENYEKVSIYSTYTDYIYHLRGIMDVNSIYLFEN